MGYGTTFVTSDRWIEDQPRYQTYAEVPTRISKDEDRNTYDSLQKYSIEKPDLVIPGLKVGQFGLPDGSWSYGKVISVDANRYVCSQWTDDNPKVGCFRSRKVVSAKLRG